MASSGASTSEASRELAAWLDRLVSTDVASREAAVAALDKPQPALMPAIVERLAQLIRTADRTAMAGVIADVVKPRPANRDEIAGRMSDGGFSRADDWFDQIMTSPAPERGGWRDLASILGLARLLAGVGTTPAIRELAALFPAYGELLRPDVERQLVILGERALPVLIEMRRGESKELRAWAFKLLDASGKAIPGEAVQTADNRLLAEVLLAYGRAKDVEAVRVVISFANNDRRQIREAAREAVFLLGETGLAALRESYESMMSQKPADAWGWEKTARELFAAFDHSRLAEAYALMDEGLASYRQQSFEAAASAFDRVLAREPGFERRQEMAPGYLAFAQTLKRGDRERAMAALRKAVRVDPGGPLAREVESDLVFLEAEGRKSHGIVDEAALRRAVQLNPGNAEAKNEILRIEAESQARSGRLYRYLFGAAFALFAIAGAAAAIVRGRRWPG